MQLYTLLRTDSKSVQRSAGRLVGDRATLAIHFYKPSARDPTFKRTHLCALSFMLSFTEFDSYYAHICKIPQITVKIPADVPRNRH
jgi:hypothetical protein